MLFFAGGGPCWTSVDSVAWDVSGARGFGQTLSRVSSVQYSAMLL